MGLVIDSFTSRVPITWFVDREFGMDIYVCPNTANLRSGDTGIEYIERAIGYHEAFAAGKIERLILVTDDLNVARKMSFLLAGDDKNDYVLNEEEGDEPRLRYTRHESEGVLLAEINMNEYEPTGPDFPESDYELDGAVFYGARNEADLKKCLNMILSCNLRYVAVIMDEDLWVSDTARRLILDYPFSHLDVRYLTPADEEYQDMLRDLIDDNSEYFGQQYENEDEISDLYDEIRRSCGDEFKEEDLINMTESMIREDILSNGICDGDSLIALWDNRD